MKFNKALLFATLMAGSLALTACEKPAQQETAPTPTPMTEEATKAEPVAPPPAPTEEMPMNAENNMDTALAQFNQSVKITATQRQMGQDVNGKDVIAVTYEVENLSEKPISAIHWASVYTLDDQALYLVDVNTPFENAIQPKEKAVVTEATFVENIPEQSRTAASDPASNIKVSIGAFQLDFADGSKIVILK